MKTTKWVSLFILAGALSFAACKDNDNEKSEQKEQMLEHVNEAKATSAVANHSIALDALPAEIKEHVSKNHPGYAIEKAVHDPLCNGGDAIDVAITKAGSTTYSLIFLPDGKYVQLEEDIDLALAPAKIIDALKVKFAGYTPAKQIEKLTLANKSTQYLLDLSKDNATKEVIFTINGDVVCEN